MIERDRTSDAAIRAIVADDCESKRSALREAIDGDPSVSVVATVGSGEELVAEAVRTRPTVVVMGVGMETLGGLAAIQELMATRPTPIVVVGSNGDADRAFGMAALKRGALDYAAARDRGIMDAALLLSRVRVCARVSVITHPRSRSRETPPAARLPRPGQYKIIGIAVSTGGPPALMQLLSRLPADLPVPVVIVQHIPEGFSQGLTSWLNAGCSLKVVEARDGMIPEGGTVYIAPAGKHLVVTRERRMRLEEAGFDECFHKPSADVMLRSLAETYGSGVIGVIMTGMGRDGVDGMRAIQDAGGLTLAQDEASSLIYGMNKIAADAGWISHIVPLGGIAERLTTIVRP
ncbi:MAG: chemotaxis protein CheB [Candidatus Eisenbacteria bacterium]